MPAIYGPDGGVLKRFFFDHTTKRSIVKMTQDVQPIVERNKESQKHTQRGEFRKVAEIPILTIYNWLNEDRIEYRRWMRMKREERMGWLKRRLNDPDNKYLRSVPGSI